MVDRMYAEQRKFALWGIKTILIALLVSYVLALLVLPIEMWCSQGLDRETFAASIVFWKKALFHPNYLFYVYAKWWHRFRDTRTAMSGGLLIPFLPCIICFGLGSGITELVLFIILCVNYGNGQTSEFVEFLNCEGVKSSAFTEKYKDIINLKDNYTPFMVLYIIFLVLNFCQSFFSNQKKEE